MTRRCTWCPPLRLLGACLLASLLFVFTDRGWAAAPQIEIAEIGFNQHYKVGHWTPVWITFSGGDQALQGQLVLMTTDGDGERTYYASHPEESVVIPPGGSLQVVRYVKFGRLRSALTVQLRQADDVVASRSFTAREMPRKIPATHQLIVTIGSAAGVDESLELRRRRERQAISHTVIAESDHLPLRWFGYASVDTVVLTTASLDLLNSSQPAQMTALIEWVRLGGHLILSMGRNGDQLLSAERELAQLVPGDFRSTVGQLETSALETFAEATQSLDALFREGERGLPVTVLSNVQGQVLVQEDIPGTGSRPLIIAAPFGLGRVTFVSFDLDQPPLAGWQGRGRLVARLLQPAGSAGRELTSEQPVAQVTHIGYEDLAGQLRSALDQFDQVVLVPFSLVVGLIIVYVLLIGPADYYLIKRSGRLWWAWITFPTVVLLFCALAYALTSNSKGQRLRINQVDLVDVDLTSSTIRGTMWANIYSPRTRTFDLTLEAKSFADQTGPADSLLSWQGLPGTGLGGLSTSAETRLFDSGYWIFTGAAPPDALSGGSSPARGAAERQPLQSQVVDMPIQVSSTKSLTAQWWQHHELPSRQRLRVDQNGLLSGLVSNPLPVELEGCLLFYGNWAYVLEEPLQPGDVVRVDNLPKRILDWHLTRRRLVDSAKTTTTPNLPWDPTSADIPRIMEMLMFHAAAGGEAYTQLSHRYQAFVDLSDQLQQGRGVLWGRSTSPGSRLLLDGQTLDQAYDQHWSFYRVVLPIEPPTTELSET